jgi:hypothetical protein
MPLSDPLAVQPSQEGDAPDWFLPVLIPAFILIACFLAYMYFFKRR